MKDNKLVVCLYGAAKDTIDDIYKQSAYELGKEIAKAGYIMSFGAGSTGLMGACARGVTENGGVTIGVTPHFMHKFEPIYKSTETIECKTMAERKETLENLSDAFVIAPGGIGTMDEFFQIITLKELQQTDKPVILFNAEGYYDKLIEAMQYMLDEGFLRHNAFTLFRVADTPEEVIFKIQKELDDGLEIQYLKDLCKDFPFADKVAPIYFYATERMHEPYRGFFTDTYEHILIDLFTRLRTAAEEQYEKTDKSVDFNTFLSENVERLEAEFNQTNRLDVIVRHELKTYLKEYEEFYKNAM